MLHLPSIFKISRRRAHPLNELQRLRVFNQVLLILLIISGFISLQFWSDYKAKAEELGVAQQSVKRFESGSGPASTEKEDALAAKNIRVAGSDDHILGTTQAKVLLYVYTDLECPFCKLFNPAVQDVIKNFSREDVSVVYRHYPLNFHANARKEAEAAECVAALGGESNFWKFTDTIFERTTSNGTGFALNKLAPLAAELGVNQTSVQQCIDAGTYASRIDRDIANGNAIGVKGTPSSILVKKGGETRFISGALASATLQDRLHSMLK